MQLQQVYIETFILFYSFPYFNHFYFLIDKSFFFRSFNTSSSSISLGSPFAFSSASLQILATFFLASSDSADFLLISSRHSLCNFSMFNTISLVSSLVHKLIPTPNIERFFAKHLKIDL